MVGATGADKRRVMRKDRARLIAAGLTDGEAKLISRWWMAPISTIRLADLFGYTPQGFVDVWNSAVAKISAAGISVTMPEACIGPDREPILFERGDDGEIWYEEREELQRGRYCVRRRRSTFRTALKSRVPQGTPVGTEDF